MNSRRKKILTLGSIAALLVCAILLFGQATFYNTDQVMNKVLITATNALRVDNSGSTQPTRENPSTNIVVAKSAANTAVTATLPAAGAGLYHYVTGIEVIRSCSAAITGSATLDITTTNLPGSLTWTVGNACAVGSTNADVRLAYPAPVKSSSANTASTVVCPAIGAAGICAIVVYYYTGT